MKKVKIIITGFVIGIITIVSCDDADFGRINPNELSPETFFKNEAQLELSLIHI